MSFVTLSPDQENELQEIQLARQSLEHFLASPSGKAGIAEFYTELAQSEGSSLDVILSKAIAAIDELTREFRILDRIAKRIDKVKRWSEIQIEQTESCSDKKIILNRVTPVYQKICWRLIKNIQSIARIVDANWNYLPVELQVMTESMARRLYLNEQSILRGNLQDDYYRRVVPSFPETIQSFISLVFYTVEQNKEKRKLELFKLFKGDERIDQLPGVTTKYQSERDAGLTVIQEVVQMLLKFPNVEQVRAIAKNYIDLHEVIFEIMPADIDSPDNGELLQKSISLVIDAEWKLSDITNNESWLFGVQMVGEFEHNLKDNSVVASSYVQSYCLP
ncbi:MAG: hypothetical protein RIE73_31230 [Coleofasciculus sp. C1-SOL-03]|uniref:hypothetical protein n=1 Tax=Coleofasciculus sp. C1-SOL-03 TaxID=3069522 RepID=UPI0032FAED07